LKSELYGRGEVLCFILVCVLEDGANTVLGRGSREATEKGRICLALASEDVCATYLTDVILLNPHKLFFFHLCVRKLRLP
jgi:hypothetical protein